MNYEKKKSVTNYLSAQIDQDFYRIGRAMNLNTNDGEWYNHGLL